MSLYLYIDRDGWVHRLHPAVRFFGALVLFAVALSADEPIWQLPLVGTVAILIWGTGSFPNVVRLRYLFAVIFVMTFFIWTVFYGSDGSPALWTIGPIEIRRTALHFALAMALKLTVFLAVGTVFLSTTRVEEFSYALSCFGLPHKIAFTITLSFRLVPVFLQTAQMVVEAQRCRGLNFDQGSVWRRARRYIPVMVPVFMGALRRTEGLAMALDARGFQLERKRTTYRAYRLGRGDLLAIAGLSALLLSYAYLRRSGQLAIF